MQPDAPLCYNVGMLSITPDGAKEFTPEQQAYILKYAAGLLLGYAGEHIEHLISPDIGDGFDCVTHDQPGLFPDWEEEEKAGKEPLIWEAHGEVVSVLDQWLDGIAKQAGFVSAAEAGPLAAGKYPTMK